jgi:acylphosphatase
MKRLIISGRVQGVFFRDSARTLANQLNLVGYAKNLPNGTLEIVIDGEKVDEFIAWCKVGPSSAAVERVEVKEVPSKEFKGFEIEF